MSSLEVSLTLNNQRVSRLWQGKMSKISVKIMIPTYLVFGVVADHCMLSTSVSTVFGTVSCLHSLMILRVDCLKHYSRLSAKYVLVICSFCVQSGTRNVITEYLHSPFSLSYYTALALYERHNVKSFHTCSRVV